MERIFQLLEKTVNKSAIDDFRVFTRRFRDVTKWFMSSDYCIDDKNKPNNVITFVLYPYILDLSQWSCLIRSLQKTDLKECRKISKEFCSFSHGGYFFSFNILIEKNSFITKLKDSKSLVKFIDDLICMINRQWKVKTPNMFSYYSNLEARLIKLKDNMKSKNFNYSLLSRVIITIFLASYIRYLTIREIDHVEIFSWLSDRDKITSCYDSIYEVLYAIISYCMCYNHLPEEKYLNVTDCMPVDIEKNIFYDDVVRIADFICGGLADYNLQTKVVHKQKHCTLLEEVIADNPNIVILMFNEKGIARCSHKKSGK